MNLLNLDILEKQNAWHSELKNMLEGLSKHKFDEETEFIPEVNIYEDDKNFYIEMDLPGIAKDEVKIKYENNYLTVSGQKKNLKHEAEVRRFYLNERTTGKFSRKFSLSEKLDASKIEAKLDNGVLEVLIPKTEPADPGARKIEIK